MPPCDEALLEADGLALALRAGMDRIALPLARAAARFVATEAWLPFGFARVNDHSRERFCRSGRWVRDMAFLGAALERLPGLGAALTGEDEGRPLGRVAALLIGRVATEASLAAWVALARGVSVRELREAVKRARASGSEWPIEASDAGASEGAAVSGCEQVSGCVRMSGGERVSACGATRAGGTTVVNGVTPAGSTRPVNSATPVGPVPETDPDADDRSLVRLPVPAPVRAAFDEAVDLHRAVQGTEATVTSFIEAVTAEALSGEAPPDLSRLPHTSRAVLKRVIDRARVESALARVTHRWRHLPDDTGASRALSLAGMSLRRLEIVARGAGEGEARDLDRQLRQLIELEDELQGRLGRLLAEMGERGAWERLMFAGVGHYAEERLRLSRTSGEDRARVARALRRYPVLREAHAAGRVGLEGALLVVRVLDGTVVDRETERAWVRRAEEGTVKRLRDEVRASLRRAVSCGWEVSAGETPSAAPTPPLLPLDDAAWHASLRRGPGTARERVLSYGMLALGGTPKGIETTSGLNPDVFLRLRLPDELALSFLAAVESRRRCLSATVEQISWDEPWPGSEDIHSGTIGDMPSVLAARMFSIRGRRVPAWVGLLGLLEEFVLTWDADVGVPKRGGDRIYIRDGWRCMAPGCTSRRNLEDHHLVYRSRGGVDELSNRVCLCRFHHLQGEHGGRARCRGTAPLGIIWRLGTRPLGALYHNEKRLRREAGLP